GASAGRARGQVVGAAGAGEVRPEGDATRQYKEALADVADRRLPEQLDIEAAVEDRSPAGGGGGRATTGTGLLRHNPLSPTTTARARGTEARREHHHVRHH